MIPRTISASSLQVAKLCLVRWKAEYLERGAGFSNAAADTGTAVHGGLEYFVKAVYMDKTHVGLTRVQEKELLISFYQMSYVETFQSTDFESLEYKDGFKLTMDWFKRTSFDEVVAVESVELKETIAVPFWHPEGPTHKCDNCTMGPATPGLCYVPLNYLMDRVDVTGDEEYRVVDYKTIRAPIQPEDLETKFQARVYALAMQIKHPNAVRIKVTFDLLRHNPVSMYFTREDNIAFWNELVSTLQNLVNADPDKLEPRLNTECGYCVQKYTCPLMQSNIAAGGYHSLNIDGKVNLLRQLQDQTKAAERIIDELKDAVLRHAYETDTVGWVTEDETSVVEVGAQKSRQFDFYRAAQIMGPELTAQMGRMTLGQLDKIVKDDSLDADMREQLKALISIEQGNLTLKIKDKTTAI